MMLQNTRITAIATAVLAALAFSACDQSPSARDPATVIPPRTMEPSSMDSRAPTPSAMDSHSTSIVAAATDDAVVTTKVRAALMAEPALKSIEIHVDTKDGVVTLTGTSDSSASRDKAVVIARNVTGVKDVVDQMASKS